MGSLSGVQLHLVDSFDQAAAFMRWLGERHGDLNTICVDTETSGLDPYARDAQIRLIQFGDEMHGWAIPWEFWSGLAIEALQKWDGWITGHNLASFDQRWVERHSPYRFQRHRIRDTMIAAHVVDPLGPGGLKPLSKKLVDSRAMAGEKILHDAMVDNRWTWATVPWNFAPYWQYGALDTVLGARIDNIFSKQVSDGEKFAYIYDLEMAARWIVTRMEQRGSRVDVDYCKRKGQELYDHAEQIKAWGKENFDTLLSSNDQLARWFMDQGESFTVFSEKTGKPSVDKWQLEIFEASSNPTVAMVAEQTLLMRKHSKIASTYFSNLIETARTDAAGDLVHANIRTLGARTSRMSVSDPPLQQLPKSSPLVRRAFVPREGRQIISTDFSQIEMRLMAHFSKDAGLQHAFKVADESGGDFFVEMGKAIYNDPGFQKSDRRRGLVKNTMYGSAYGAGVRKMAESAGVTPEQMQPVVNMIRAKFPGLQKFQKDIERLGREREKNEGQGYVVTPFGRRLPCDEGRTYTLVNYCLAPDTPILKSDLTHIAAMKIAVGDRVVAFDEYPVANDAPTVRGRSYRVRRMRTAVVEAVSTVVKPTLRLTLSDGRVLESSDDHLWLIQRPTKTQPRTIWAQTKDLTVGSTLLSLGRPWQVDESRGAGWLAGLYDGEGCLTLRGSGKGSSALAFSQLPGPVMDRFRYEMEARRLGYRYQTRSSSSTSPTDTCMITGVANILRTLGTLRPTRFEPRFECVYEGAALTGGTTEYVQVTKIEDLGDQELTSVQTSTRTLIANGVLSHNCLQGHAAEVFKKSLVELEAAGFGEYMILPVHDEIVMDMPEDLVADALHEVPEVMKAIDGYDVPIYADAEGGFSNWGEKYE